MTQLMIGTNGSGLASFTRKQNDLIIDSDDIFAPQSNKNSSGRQQQLPIRDDELSKMISPAPPAGIAHHKTIYSDVRPAPKEHLAQPA